MVGYDINIIYQVNNNVIWDDNMGRWRHTTMADKVCRPPTDAEMDEYNNDSNSFNVGCKVADHDGPLAEGWEANSQWKENNARKMPGVEDGEVSNDDFGKWADFANCMKGNYR